MNKIDKIEFALSIVFLEKQKNRLSADYQKRSAFFGIEMREDIYIVRGEPFTFSFSTLFIIIEIMFFPPFWGKGNDRRETKTAVVIQIHRLSSLSLFDIFCIT